MKDVALEFDEIQDMQEIIIGTASWKKNVIPAPLMPTFIRSFQTHTISFVTQPFFLSISQKVMVCPDAYT